MKKEYEPYHEEEPWGHEEVFANNELSTVKILTINAGEALSLQRHENRDEFWKIIGGKGYVTVGEERHPTKTGDEYFIPRGSNHRAEGGEGPLQVLEISFGAFDKNDEVRLEDKYGRA